MNPNFQLAAIILQAISSLSIGGGLIFAAYQFYHARKAQHVANFTKLVELQMSLRRMRVENPKLANVYTDDVRNLHGEDEIRHYFFNLMQLSLFEIAWYSHEHGQLSDEYFESWVKRFRVIAAEDSFRRMMANPSMKILHDGFQTYAQTFLEEKRGAGKA
ncbi:MAG: hypothetical protein KF805_11915 [Phycisphaeraceae bacterium]|nr:hypothetical protein [Phycisphaeraceae bacterium]